MTFRSLCVLLFALVSPLYSRATHLIGGSMTYRHIHDTTYAGLQSRVYEVTLVIYENCINGEPEATAQDNPAFLSCYINNSPSYTLTNIDTAVYFSSSVTVPLNLTNSCNNITPNYPHCVLKKTFIKRYVLPVTTSGYVISYQRCCRSASIANVRSPGDNGPTLFCIIPGTIANNSAVFKNEAPFGICSHQLLNYDHSATDADGDSLTYEFSPAVIGASDADVRPIPGPPPYDTVRYLLPFTSQQPIIGAIPITVNTMTGKISGLPDRLGHFVVNVCCKEWRHGILINTTNREFATVVGECTITNLSFTPNIGNDTTIFAGQRIRLHGGPGAFYYWKPTANVSDSTGSDPMVYFPVPGVYHIFAYIVDDSGCTGADTITIDVISHSEFAVPNAFTPNGDNVNDILTPIPIKGSKLINFKVFNRWGNLVYNGGPSDPGWNGYHKGTLQDMAVYYWHLEYEDTFGEQHSMSGNTTLLR